MCYSCEFSFFDLHPASCNAKIKTTVKILSFLGIVIFNDIQTYKEIVAFTEGKRLDEIQKIEEKAKRPYQKVIDGFLWAAVALLISAVMIFLLRL